jgi:hypothetical protein
VGERQRPRDRHHHSTYIKLLEWPNSEQKVETVVAWEKGGENGELVFNRFRASVTMMRKFWRPMMMVVVQREPA